MGSSEAAFIQRGAKAIEQLELSRLPASVELSRNAAS
jgi:hypothetical protein